MSDQVRDRLSAGDPWALADYAAQQHVPTDPYVPALLAVSVLLHRMTEQLSRIADVLEHAGADLSGGS